MKILVIGAGPAGLSFAYLLRKVAPEHEITVVERHAATDAYGWGVVFPRGTLSYLDDLEEGRLAQLRDIHVVHGGATIVAEGVEYVAIDRLRLLIALQDHCARIGIPVTYGTTLDLREIDRSEWDLIVAADGANSHVRSMHPEWDTTHELGNNVYAWLGTSQVFDTITLMTAFTDAGRYLAHAYKFEDDCSTFIVECDRATWSTELDGASADETCARLGAVFAERLGGHPLLHKGTVRWRQFDMIRNRRWSLGNVVLLGDALHTCHFSVGYGTVMAIHDALNLTMAVASTPTVPAALSAFEELRRANVEGTQDVASDMMRRCEAALGMSTATPEELAAHLIVRGEKRRA